MRARSSHPFRPSHDRLKKALAFSLGIGLAAVPTTQAQLNQTWLPTGATNNWNTADLNWDAGAVWVNNNNAIFSTTPAETVTVSESDIVFNDITFGLTGYVIADGTGSLRLGNDLASTITSTVAAATINESIANNAGGASSLTKAGTGLLTLGGLNTFSGGTTISGGPLAAASNTALGSGPVSVTGVNGTQLQLGTGVNVANALTINGGGVTAQGILYVPVGSATYSGTINITANAGLGGHFATAGAPNVLTIAGENTITNSAPSGVSVRLGRVVYSGAQSYTGGTVLGNAGAAIQFVKPTSMPATGTVALSTGTSVAINVGGVGEFTDGSGTTTAGTIGGLLAGIGGQGAPVTLAAGASVGIDTTNAAGTITYSSPFTALNNAGLLKLGTGTLALTSGGTYAGGGAAGFPFVTRAGTLLLNGGTHTVTGEAVVGGDYGTAPGSAGLNARLQVDAGALNISTFLSVGRGNGTGGVSSDLVANNAATITAANFSGGFNAGSGLNLPRGSVTLNNTSSLTVTGVNFNLAESAGSDITITLNSSALLNASGTAAPLFRIGQAGTGKIVANDNSAVTVAGNTGGFRVGEITGSNGRITLNGTSTLTHNGNASGTNIGMVGTGILDIASTTATANVRNLIIGQGTGGVGAVYNRGTLLSINLDGLFLGDGTNSASYFRNDNAGAAANAVAGNIAAGIGAGSNAVVDVVSGTLGAVRAGTGFFQNQSNNGQFNVLGGELAIGAAGFLFSGDTVRTGVKWGNVNVTGGTFSSTGPINLSVTNDAANLGLLSVKTGGTVTADTITATGTASGNYLNFDGGTLKAVGATALLVTANIDRLTVNAGGLVVDTNGVNKSIDAVVAAPLGSGVTGVALSGTGTSYEGRPIVKITGDGTGATAVADFNPVTGEVTGVTITSPGSGYTTATVAVLGGGGTALTATPTLGAVTGGGIEKIGVGILTLSATDTYTGPTTVTGGSLLVTGSLTGTTGITVASSATFGGTGTVHSGATTTIAAGGNLAPGITTGQLNTGSVAFATGGDFTLELNGATLGALYDHLNVIGTVTLGGADLFVSLGAGFAPTIGQTFTLVGNDLAESVIGNFATVNGGAFGAGNTFSLANDQGTFQFATSYVGEGASTTGGNDIVIQVVPEPGTALSLLGGVGMLLGLRRRRR